MKISKVVSGANNIQVIALESSLLLVHVEPSYLVLS